MDAVTDILSSLRLTGGVVIDGALSGDFCVHAEFTPNHCAPFFEVPDALISYHFVRSGQAVIQIEGQPPVSLGPGDIAILPRNDPHLLASRPGLEAAGAEKIMWVTTEGIHKIETGTGGPATDVWCGFLGTEKGSVHPLIEALPPLLTIRTKPGGGEWVDSSLRFLAEEQPLPETVAKLAEVFVAEAIRKYLDQLPQDSSGWLRGLTDPAVSRALSIIHRRYAEELTVEELAREVGVSRSVLGERFVELLGEPPMRYCAKWRMRVAANMLRDGKQNSANIGYSVGFNSEAAFNRAFKREYGVPPATWRRQIEEKEREEARRLKRELPPQEVRYCTAADGTRLAFSLVGEGPPVVKTANWLNHIEHDWDSPIWRHWLAELTDGRTLIRYDERGNGLSDWDTPELSFEAFVDDLETVIDAAGLDQFDLLGISQGAAVSIAYAIRHPERVRKMILYGGYAAGWAKRGSPEEIARREAMVTITRTGWGSDNPAFRQLFTNLYMPGATDEQVDWFNELQRKSASPENAVKIQLALSTVDVRELLAKVQTPTLVIHARDDGVIPFASGVELARGIPGARFVALEGNNHILLEDEPAWPGFTAAVRDFLGHEAREYTERPKAAPKPKDTFGKCASADGTAIAFASCGEGFPVVKAPTCFTNLEHDWSNPVYRHWVEELSRSNRLVRADMRGFGLSERGAVEFSIDRLVDDLAAVVDAAEAERFDIVGLAHGAAVAIAFAARNPDRVRKLVLVNSFAAGWAARGDPDEIAWRQSLIQLNRKRWAREGVALGERFVGIYFPSAATEMIEWHKHRFDELGSAENLEAMLEWGARFDVRDELANVKAQALVFHSDNDGNAAVEVGRAVADGIAGSRFVELDSSNHMILEDEPAWAVVRREVRAFLAS